MENEDKLLNDIQNLLDENNDLIKNSEDDNESLQEETMSIKDKTNELKKQRKKDTLIINRHLGYKRKYLEEKRWLKSIFYITLIVFCVVCIYYLMPYKG